jgi:aryl-alcohol dehydrogenase-like predicted oxidoreductase
MKSEAPAKTKKLPSRKLGRTGFSVSEIGFGGWGIGKSMWGKTDDAESMLALRAALEGGVTYFDTAYAYGHGHSERLIAKALKGWGSPVVVSTKVPPRNMEWPAHPWTALGIAFPPDWIELCAERSLRNLATDSLQILQFHVWHDNWLKDPLWPEVADTFTRLKKAGKIRFIGASINSDDPNSALELVRSGFVDQLQILFNMFDQRAADKLFGLCKEKKVGVVVRCPFDEGGLTGQLTPNTKFEPGDFRSHYFGGDRLAETCKRAAELEKIVVGEKAENLAIAALKYCLSFDEVSTVIPGMRKVTHVKKNCAAADGDYYDAKTLKAVAKHRWIRDYYL